MSYSRQRVIALRQRTTTCIECQVEFQAETAGKLPIFCQPCRMARFRVQQNAYKELLKARCHGLVEPWFGKSCEDCGKPAQCHDHRDYTKPLEVAPVCNSCNAKRPLAKWRASA